VKKKRMERAALQVDSLGRESIRLGGTTRAPLRLPNLDYKKGKESAQGYKRKKVK